MKKIILSAIMMGICAVSAMAQKTDAKNSQCDSLCVKGEAACSQCDTTICPTFNGLDMPCDSVACCKPAKSFKGFNISLQGGMLFSMNENSWTYYNDNKSNKPSDLAAAREKLGYGMKNLFTPQVSLSIGYDFGHAFGVRVQGNFAQNASAGNHNEDAKFGFYPYTFKSVSAFGDAVFNISGFINPAKQHLLETKIYAGLGFGHALSADTKYLPDGKDGGQKYDIVVPANAFAFRAGLIEEIFINDHIGAFVDVNLESYTDKFNGFVSFDTELDQSFPYDLRVVGSLGLIYHF